MGSGEPMSSERLAELREHRDEARFIVENDDDMRFDDPVILWQDVAVDLTDLLAEVERLLAREAAARPIVAAVLGYDDYTERSVLLTMREQARAWLASADESAKGGGDGQR